MPQTAALLSNSPRPTRGNAPSVRVLKKNGINGESPSLIVNRAKLLAVIENLQKEKSADSFRKKVALFEECLLGSRRDRMGVFNITAEGDAIRFSREHLLAEWRQICAAQSMARARYYLSRLQKGVSVVKTGAINDINLNRWREYDDIVTDSLWIINRRDNSGVHMGDYWGNFVPQIPNQMLRRYTKKGDWVLDSFAGCGTTLIESQRLGRNGIGIELQPKIAAKARALVAAEPNRFDTVNKIVAADCLEVDYAKLLRARGQQSAQLLIMHPPYHDIIRFSDDKRDLSNAESIEAFLAMMGKAVENAASVLARGRYFALVIGDKYAKSEWIPLAFMTMNEVLRRGFTLKSVIVKNFAETAGKRNQSELWRYRALSGGFYVFKHEYIFVFRKSAR